MNKISFRILYVLLALLMVFSIVACKNEVQPEPTPEPQEFTVTFDAQNGSPVTTVTVMEGEKVREPSVEPTKDGYYFGGWWTKKASGNYNTAYKFSKKVTGDLTLYARWWTTEYYMPAGWTQTIPAWSDPDTGTVEIPDYVLAGDFETEVTNVTPELKAALAAAIADPDYFKDVKNVIFIISDGMGVTHVKASEQWSGELIMTQLPNIGVSVTTTRERASGNAKYSGDITDSAAGGTALSAGYKTTKLFAAMDAEGNNLKSVSELAREQGKLVGIVTNAELADATPAVYSIHNKNRSQGWTKMCEQEVVFGADLFMGNGYSDYNSYFNSTNELYPITVANNMELYNKASDIISHFTDNKKMWAVFSGTADKFARFDTTSTAYPNLQQMTAYALSWLDYQDRTNNSDKGFVVMIENTYTDIFGHGHSDKLPVDGSPNTFGIVKEVQSTDEAVAIALKYVLEHPDTALIVTADHETGDTTLRKGWESDFTLVEANSGSHSDQNVPVFAIGKGTEVLNTLGKGVVLPEGVSWYDIAIGDSKHPEYEDYWYENSFIGQVVGALLGDDTFGGDVATDDSSKSSPKFEITTTAAANTLTFTLEMTGPWIQSGNYIQFKIKPVNTGDSIKVEVESKDGTTKKEALAQTVFSSTNNNVLEMNGYYATTPLMKAYNQAFRTDTGWADGWYQVSVPSTLKGNKLVITLTSASSFPAGSKIEMDDLTVQFASTIGYIKFSSDKATASGACLVAE